FWNTELGTGLAVVGAAQATGLRQFDAAVRHSVAGFNFIYADDAGHIAYWHTGTIPIRARGHDPRLPVPGDGRVDWRGFWSKRLLSSLRGLTPLERNVVGIVNAWNGSAFYPGGACGAQVCSPAFPIMEAWFKALEARAGAAVFGPALGNKPVADAVRAFTRTP